MSRVGVRWVGVREIAEEQLARAREPYPTTKAAEADRNARAHGAALALAVVMLRLLDGEVSLPPKPHTRRTK